MHTDAHRWDRAHRIGTAAQVRLYGSGCERTDRLRPIGVYRCASVVPDCLLCRVPNGSADELVRGVLQVPCGGLALIIEDGNCDLPSEGDACVCQFSAQTELTYGFQQSGAGMLVHLDRQPDRSRLRKKHNPFSLSTVLSALSPC
jgi:hypothetical protein